jgi:hypothetical protein
MNRFRKWLYKPTVSGPGHGSDASVSRSSPLRTHVLPVRPFLTRQIPFPCPCTMSLSLVPASPFPPLRHLGRPSSPLPSPSARRTPLPWRLAWVHSPSPFACGQNGPLSLPSPELDGPLLAPGPRSRGRPPATSPGPLPAPGKPPLFPFRPLLFWAQNSGPLNLPPHFGTDPLTTPLRFWREPPFPSP